MKSLVSSNLAKSMENGVATSSLSATSTRNGFVSSEEHNTFSTIDGDMISYHAGENAVNSGAGIFIGGYFVGVADNLNI